MADSAEPPRSVEEVKAMLETTEKGGFRNSMSNCLTVFQCDPLLSGAVAYNLLTDRTDILKPIGYKRTPDSPMTDTDMKYIRLYLEETYGLTSEKKIQDAADLAAHQNSYHPVREYSLLFVVVLVMAGRQNKRQRLVCGPHLVQKVHAGTVRQVEITADHQRHFLLDGGPRFFQCTSRFHRVAPVL